MDDQQEEQTQVIEDDFDSKEDKKHWAKLIRNHMDSKSESNNLTKLPVTEKHLDYTMQMFL
jgi:hypothetical protein